MELQQKYNSIIDAYIKHFEKKHKLKYVKIVGVLVKFISSNGDIIKVNNFDLRYDHDNNIPAYIYREWYNTFYFEINHTSFSDYVKHEKENETTAIN